MQLAYSENPAIGRRGMLADLGPHYTKSKIASGKVRAGYGVFRTPGYGDAGSTNLDPGQVYNIPSPGVAADVDAIGTGAVVKSAASNQTLLAAVMDGVVAGADMSPARKLTLICDASTDWDATTGVITFINQDGNTVQENLAIATSASLTTTGYARRFVSLYIPAQTGAGGTATLGVAVLDTVTAADFVGVCQYEAGKEPAETDATATPAEYADGATLPILDEGQIYVTTEEACDPTSTVYVRIGAGSGGSQMGAFRASADSATAVALSNCRYARVSGVGGLNVLEVRR